jgi:uncharacterized protein (TIGR02265 family)
MSPSDAGFAVPDWNGPLDAEAQIAHAPEDGVIKGLFYQDILNTCAAMQASIAPTRPRYLPFIDYPLREYMALLVQASAALHPREPLRNGLRRLGRLAYPTLAGTLIGRAIFGIAGHNFGTILSLASRAYSVSLKPGDVDLVERSEGRGIVHLRNLWNFPDSYQVGVFEGALIAVGVRGKVLVRTHSPCDVDFEVTWEEQA